MPLTPQDVSNKRFTPVRLREGYDMGEVDQFLDEVESELARLLKENEELRSQGGPDAPATGLSAIAAGAAADGGSTSAGDAAAASGGAAPVGLSKAAPDGGTQDPADGSQGSGASTPAEPGSKTFTGTRTGGETIRVETVPQASTAAARLLEIATRNADQLVDEAQADADRIVGEARTQAERLDTESRERAERTEADARQRAQHLDTETTERREQLFGDLEKERTKLSGDVETLRSFEREYRSRLRDYFTQQLTALDGPGAAAGDPVEPGSSAESGDSPRRLRSILGEESS